MNDLYNLKNLKIGDWVWFKNQDAIDLGIIIHVFTSQKTNEKTYRVEVDDQICSYTIVVTLKNIIRKEHFPLGENLREILFNRKIKVHRDLTWLSNPFKTEFQGKLSKPQMLHPKNVEYIPHFLPTEIVFNIDKGKTTLLFGSQDNYTTFTATVEDLKDFDFVQGFSVAYYKFIKNEADNRNKEVQNMIQRMYNLGIGDIGFQTIAKEYLLEEGLSVTQTKKLFDKLEDLLPKNNTFKMNVTVGKNMIHEIEVVVKTDEIIEKINKTFKEQIEKIEEAIKVGGLVNND